MSSRWKRRIMLMVAIAADGSKRPLSVVGQAKQLECFQLFPDPCKHQLNILTMLMHTLIRMWHCGGLECVLEKPHLHPWQHCLHLDSWQLHCSDWLGYNCEPSLNQSTYYESAAKCDKHPSTLQCRHHINNESWLQNEDDSCSFEYFWSGWQIQSSSRAIKEKVSWLQRDNNC